MHEKIVDRYTYKNIIWFKEAQHNKRRRITYLDENIEKEKNKKRVNGKGINESLRESAIIKKN